MKRGREKDLYSAEGNQKQDEGENKKRRRKKDE